MKNNEHDDWDEDDEDDWDEDEEESPKDIHKQHHHAIQKMFADMESKAKKSLHYLVTEGFLEPTDDPSVYKYTPEGLVLAQQQYKKMQEDGLL